MDCNDYDDWKARKLDVVEQRKREGYENDFYVMSEREYVTLKTGKGENETS